MLLAPFSGPERPDTKTIGLSTPIDERNQKRF
jgi:hypothetical protein